ncbi:MAG: hypothetical protein AAFR17_00320 [Pseudomonadota bacterium]
MKRSGVFAVLASLIAVPAAAAPFHVEFWDVDIFDQATLAPGADRAPSGEVIGDAEDNANRGQPGGVLDDVLSVIDRRTPDFTFQSTAIDYPGPSGGFNPETLANAGGETLGDFLGPDAAALTAAQRDTELLGSIFRFTGLLGVEDGVNAFELFSDDGFQLTVDGVLLGEFTGIRAFGSDDFDLALTEGGVPFELIYYDALTSQAGVQLLVNGETATPVPLPASLAMMLSGFGLLALFGIGRLRRPLA